MEKLWRTFVLCEMSDHAGKRCWCGPEKLSCRQYGQNCGLLSLLLQKNNHIYRFSWASFPPLPSCYKHTVMTSVKEESARWGWWGRIQKSFVTCTQHISGRCHFSFHLTPHSSALQQKFLSSRTWKVCDPQPRDHMTHLDPSFDISAGGVQE